jgi:starch phosphorylase
MPEFENRIVFIEDYDTYVGRRLYQGVDLWLNNPVRPLEASGTSGMKLPPNGGLNLSVLDGWWCEAYEQNQKAGWAIGAEILDGPIEFQNEVDVASLFHILETQVIPLYYAKPDGRLPLAWLQLMRESIRSVLPVFNTHRMVKEYAERLYEPAAKAHHVLGAASGKRAVELSKWKDSIRKAWPQIHISDVKVTNAPSGQIAVGDSVEVSAVVHLGPIAPEYVTVQAYFGEAVNNEIQNPAMEPLQQASKIESGRYLYHGPIPARESGSYGLSVRVIPTHPNLTQDHELRLITWAR